jgi:hypothetical protein
MRQEVLAVWVVALAERLGAEDAALARLAQDPESEVALVRAVRDFHAGRPVPPAWWEHLEALAKVIQPTEP